MPLSFETESHGEIPIGFFNIESDMFLINNYFIFADDLCSAITEWTGGADTITSELEMYVFANPGDIGNLMGAINGIVFTGFIGELYKLYPFPSHPENFRQNPEGYKTRAEVENIIVKFAKREKIKIHISQEEGAITLGEYKFNPSQFHEVIAYIWRGGMPQWKNGKRPVYVEKMMKAVLGSEHWLFKGSLESNKNRF
ncbi:MAG: hypothetical protein JSV49_08690 [Thermoplasmata archaeon]|nr:MAG: hypothetical protein JSV49_08690 [Thermoplasmata archaeon]